MGFYNIKEYEFSPRIDAEIYLSRYEKQEISIEQIVSNGEVRNEITIDVDGLGYEASSSQIVFNVEDIENLIAQFKKNGLVKL